MTLHSFLQALDHGPIVPRPSFESWPAMIERTKPPGFIYIIDQDTYLYFLEVLPPRWMHRSYFAFAEGCEPVRLFWCNHHYYVRPLTWDETNLFCQLAR